MSTLKEHQTVLFELLNEFDRVCKKHNIKYMLFAGSMLGAVRHQGFIPWDDDLDVALLREDYDKLMKVDKSEWNSDFYFQGEYSDHWPLHFSKLRKNNTTCLEKYHPKDNNSHQGIYIDVFPIDNASNNEVVRKLQYYASRIIIAKAFDKRGYETNSKAKKIFMTICRIVPLKPFSSLSKLRSAKDSDYVHSFFGGTSSYKKGIYSRKWIAEITEKDFEGNSFPVSAHYDELLTAMYGNYMELPKESERKTKEHALLVDIEKNYTEYEHYRDNLKFDVLTRSIR